MTRIAAHPLRGKRIRRIEVPALALAWDGRDWAVTMTHFDGHPHWSRPWTITHRPTGYRVPVEMTPRGRPRIVALAQRLDQCAPRFRALPQGRARAAEIIAVLRRVTEAGVRAAGRV